MLYNIRVSHGLICREKFLGDEKCRMLNNLKTTSTVANEIAKYYMFRFYS